MRAFTHTFCSYDSLTHAGESSRERALHVARARARAHTHAHTHRLSFSQVKAMVHKHFKFREHTHTHTHFLSLSHTQVKALVREHFKSRGIRVMSEGSLDAATIDRYIMVSCIDRSIMY